jgi:hypothetical protein
MTRFGRILGARLHARQGAGDHLDENQICGFAENSLTPHERGTAVAHLASCADCREALALSAPQSSALASSARSIAPWAWAGIAAAVAAICLLPLWLLRPHKPAAEITLNASPPVEMARNAAPSQPPIAPPSRAARQQKIRHAPQPVLKTPLSVTATGAAEQLHPMATAASPAPPPSAPAPDAAKVPPPKAIAARAFLQPRSPATQTPHADRLAQAVGGLTGQNAATFQSRADVGQAGFDAYPTPAIWAVDVPQNQVERSMDQGKTWQPVPIASQVRFQAVATSGPNIWAGGSDGALFRSLDNGSHWEPVFIGDSSTKLSATIVSIDSPTPTQIRVTTATGERWISTDGGRHWTKSP